MATNPCEGLAIELRLPTLECTDNTLGNFGNLVDFGRGIGSIPGQLARLALCVSQEVFAQIQDAISAVSALLDEVFSGLLLSVPSPVFVRLKIPEFEMEIRLRALWNEFKIFVVTKVVDILLSLPLIGSIVQALNIPIPFLNGVRLFDVFTEEGRARIRQAVAERVEDIAALFGGAWNMIYNGALGLTSLEQAAQMIVSRVYIEIEKMFANLLYTAFRAFINLPVIKQIWQLFSLVLIPAFQSLDFNAMFNQIWSSVQDLAISTAEKMQAVIDSFLNFSIEDWLVGVFGPVLKALWPFPFSIGALLNLFDREWNLVAPEIAFERIMMGIENLFARISQIMFELWYNYIIGFIRAVVRRIPGLSLLLTVLEWLNLTFCGFLNLAAVPVLALVGTVTNLLPSGIPVRIV